MSQQVMNRRASRMNRGLPSGEEERLAAPIGSSCMLQAAAGGHAAPGAAPSSFGSTGFGSSSTGVEGGSGGIGGGSYYGADGLEAPLAAEVAAATRDAARGLDAAIGAINDALVEIRDAIDELTEEADAGMEV